jgi:MFS family permease
VSRIAGVVATALVVQAILMGMSVAPAVFAPVAAPALGVEPHWVGTLFGLSGLGAMFSGTAMRALVDRFGPVRTLQLTALGMAVSMAMGASGIPLLALAAGLAIGLSLGPLVPSLLVILTHAAPPGRLAFLTSIQQMGPPIGMAAGGALLPALIVAAGWREALGVLVALALATAIGIGFMRDPGGKAASGAPRARFSLFGPLALVARTPRLRLVAIAGFALSVVFLGQAAFLVAYLSVELGYGLVAAGLLFSCSLGGAIVGRVLWGWVADRRDSIFVLGLLLVLAGATSFALAAWPRGGMPALLAVVVFLFGATASGWQGVFYAGAAQSSPPGALVEGTGGAQFWFFGGGVGGSFGLALVIGALGNYWSTYAILGVLSALTGAWVLAARRRLV